MRKIFVVLFALALIGTVMQMGCGSKQTEAVGSGEKVQQKVEEEKPSASDQDLSIEKVTILKYGEGKYTHYQIIFYASNKSSRPCKAGSITATLYDAEGKVVANSEGSLGNVSPPGRWVVVPDPIYNTPSEPVRAEIVAKNISFSDMPHNERKFETIQADYIPGTHGLGKVVGMFRYQGEDISTLKIIAVLLDEAGSPVGSYEGYKNNVSSGNNPFELQLGDTTSENVSSVELSFL